MRHEICLAPGRSPSGTGFVVPFKFKLLSFDAVVDDVHLVGGAGKALRDLIQHVLRAHDHAPGFVGEPIFLLMDVPLKLAMNPAIASFLGRVDSGDHGELVFVLELTSGFEREPVVGVENGGLTARTPIFEKLTAPEIGGFVQQLDFVDKVIGLLFKVNPVDMDAALFDFLVNGKWCRLGDDVNLAPDFHELL